MEPIDIVIPYVNFNDSHWQYYYHLYKPNCGPGQRFRETNTLKFQLRSIEKNLPWIRNVYLILAYETQIPKWLNPEAKGLKIVYHKDYIPKQFLPTFNSNVIELFFNKLEGLSDKFIASNDDMIFTKENPVEWYFQGDRPVYNITIKKDFKLKSNQLFDHIVYRNAKLANEFCATGEMLKPADKHLPMPHIKRVWDDIWTQYSKTLLDSIKLSKFRKPYNVSHWLFSYICILSGLTVHKDYDAAGYCSVRDDINYDYVYKKIHNHPVVCLNDSIHQKTFWWNTITDILEEIFPEKSKFEL